jgi:DNA-binding LacI/PurR family transcriptional regulator
VLRALQRGGLTLLSLDQRLDERGIPSILHEKQAGGRAVRFLIEAGRYPVLFVGRITGSAIGSNRYRGYRAALAEAGLPLRRELVFDTAYRYSAGYEAVRRAIDAGTDFSAVQASSDEIALGAMAALHDHGRRVPEDVAVIGFGNIDWGAHMRPALTTLSVHHDAVAAALRSALQNAEGGAEVPMLVSIGRSLIRRASA